MHHRSMHHERSVHHHVTTQRLTNRRSDANRTAAPRLATRRDAWGTRPATPSPGVGPNGCPEGVFDRIGRSVERAIAIVGSVVVEM
jgi:hypothetical protein